VCLNYCHHIYLNLLNYMYSNVTIENVSWPHFSWATLYVVLQRFLFLYFNCVHVIMCHHRVFIIFFISHFCSIVFSTLLLLHIRWLCANKNFLLTYLLISPIIMVAQQQTNRLVTLTWAERCARNKLLFDYR